MRHLVQARFGLSRYFSPVACFAYTAISSGRRA
jgi:hypothetical protein